MTNNIISYQEQLESQEWKLRRDAIIKRDGNKCSFCGKGQSVFISFDDVTFYVGFDYSKSDVDCTKVIPSTDMYFSDYIKSLCIKAIKRGVLPNSDMIGFLSDNGDFFYSPWKKNDSYKSIDMKMAHVVKTQCDDGANVSVIYIEDKDLKGLKIPRVYVQRGPTNLQVHHKRYIMNKKAWEYEDADLATLCQDCHSKVHKFLPVQAYAIVNGQMKVMNYTPCQRCNGTGYFPEYKYVENGICFRCRGARFDVDNN